jgi:dihydrofolate reductase
MTTFKPSVEVIYAKDPQGLIGIKDKIPWKLSADLKRFKQMTMGHTLMMGRKTYESIGRALPDRVNVVITSKHDLVETDELITYSDPIDFIKKYKSLKETSNKLFIIGGRSLIADIGFKYADVIHETIVFKNFEHDVINMSDGIYIPNIPFDHFKMKEQTAIHTGENLLTYRYITYRRI